MRFYKQALHCVEKNSHRNACLKFVAKNNNDLIDQEREIIAADGYKVDTSVLPNMSGAEKRKLHELLLKAKIFIITTDYDKQPITDVEDDSTLDLPFEVCWFEPAPEKDGTYKARTINAKGEHGVEITPFGMLVHETSPGVFDLYSLQTYKFADETSKSHNDQSWGGFVYYQNLSGPFNFAGAICHDWLAKLRTGVAGVETWKEKRTTGSRSEKKKPIIRQIIRVFPKREKATAKPLHAKTIDWSHRWTVRGHWRKLDPQTLGKNRQGEYSVFGHTWVSDFEKGPEGAVLYDKKIRIFKG